MPHYCSAHADLCGFWLIDADTSLIYRHKSALSAFISVSAEQQRGTSVARNRPEARRAYLGQDESRRKTRRGPYRLIVQNLRMS